MIKMNFYCGQKVVCVSYQWDSIWDAIRALFFRPSSGDLVVGEVYTVSNLILDDVGDVYTVEVAECPHPENKFWEAGFAPECFRPVVERKTDISVFTRMLTAKRKELQLAR